MRRVDTTPARGPIAAPVSAGGMTGYELLFELAQGGMGSVHLGRATGERAGARGFERLVAIKRLHPHLLADAESVERFLQEARVAARVHHANVVGVHQVGRDERGHFLVQDYVEGDTLEGLIDASIVRRARLPPPIVLRIALDALAGLHAVHEASDPSGAPLCIVHRDVSTQNLLVGRDGVARLADFGIAKYAQSSVVTDARYLQGRVLYMPPEYLRRQPVDRRFDIYGIGITLWIALSGCPPWADSGDAQIVHLATTQGIPPLSASGLSIAPAIEALVARACHPDPARRFPSARVMLEAIEALGRDTGWIASHAEVADWVETLVGRELRARRAAILRAVEGLAEPGSPSAPATTEGRGARRRRTSLAGASVALLIAVSALAFVRMRAPKPAAAIDAQRDDPATATSSLATSSIATPVLAPSGALSAAASSPAAETSAAPLPSLPSRSGHPSASAPARAPSASASARGPAEAPTTIATVNPYR
jgi:tRNA A-37 threonylcarbamoyl transferase component Bud32